MPGFRMNEGDTVPRRIGSHMGIQITIRRGQKSTEEKHKMSAKEDILSKGLFHFSSMGLLFLKGLRPFLRH